MGKNPPQQRSPLSPSPAPQCSPFLPPHCLGVEGSAQGLQPPRGAEEGVGCGPGAIWPQLAPCPLCPPCPRVSGQDRPYMAEVRPTASMFPAPSNPTNPP